MYPGDLRPSHGAAPAVAARVVVPEVVALGVTQEALALPAGGRGPGADGHLGVREGAGGY